MADTVLDIDLRRRRLHEAMQRARPRLPQNLRQLGAVGCFVPPPPAGSQRTVIHGWMTKGQTIGTHLDYLQKGKGRDGTDASLFGRDVALDVAAFATRAAQDGHQFRFSVSLDRIHPFFALQPYIEALMRQVEHDLGRPLDWVSAVHYDTAHTHAHVVLRGKDRHEQDLYITKDYLTHGLRYRADRIATWLLGLARSQERTQDRTQTQTKEPPMFRLTPAQQQVVTYLRQHGFAERLFGDLEVFPGRTPQDASYRRTLNALVRAGVLEQPDPLRHQFRFREQAQEQPQTVSLGHTAEQHRGQETGL